MGVDWTSYTILGVKLNRDKCYTVIQKSGCEHDLPDKSFEFCPKCGKQALIDAEVLLEFLEDPGKWPDGISQCTSTDDEDYFVGIIISCGGCCDEQSIAFMEYEHAMSFRKERLKDILTQRGLWEPDQYKIWNVLRCSY